MKVLSIFPYTYETATLIRYRKNINNYQLKSVISYKTDSALFNQLNIAGGIRYTTNFYEGLGKADSVLLCEDHLNFQPSIYGELLQVANELNVEVVLSGSLFKRLKDCNFKIGLPIIFDDHWKQSEEAKILKTIEVPVISVLGMGENCSKFPLQIYIRHYLQEKNYKVLSISSNPLSVFFGMRTLPDYLFSNDLSFSQKILNFNNLVYEACTTMKPDVVLIGYPGGIMPLNEYFHNYFAELPLLISNAIISDIALFTMYLWPQYTKMFFERINQLCANKFALNIDGYCISPTNFNYDKENMRMDYRFFNEKFYSAHIPNIDESSGDVFGLLDTMKTDAVLEKLINSLVADYTVI